MSRLNKRPRVIKTVHRVSTIIHPSVSAQQIRDYGLTKNDFVTVRTIDTHGSWPMAYMLPDEQLVHLAILANHLPARASNRVKEASAATRKRVANRG